MKSPTYYKKLTQFYFKKEKYYKKFCLCYINSILFYSRYYVNNKKYENNFVWNLKKNITLSYLDKLLMDIYIFNMRIFKKYIHALYFHLCYINIENKKKFINFSLFKKIKISRHNMLSCYKFEKVGFIYTKKISKYSKKLIVNNTIKKYQSFLSSREVFLWCPKKIRNIKVFPTRNYFLNNKKYNIVFLEYYRLPFSNKKSTFFYQNNLGFLYDRNRLITHMKLFFLNKLKTTKKISSFKMLIFQFLSFFLLEPQWEARFEKNVYGSRPGRSYHDIIEKLFINLCLEPKYIIHGEIKKRKVEKSNSTNFGFLKNNKDQATLTNSNLINQQRFLNDKNLIISLLKYKQTENEINYFLSNFMKIYKKLMEYKFKNFKKLLPYFTFKKKFQLKVKKRYSCFLNRIFLCFKQNEILNFIFINYQYLVLFLRNKEFLSVNSETKLYPLIIREKSKNYHFNFLSKYLKSSCCKKEQVFEISRFCKKSLNNIKLYNFINSFIPQEEYCLLAEYLKFFSGFLFFSLSDFYRNKIGYSPILTSNKNFFQNILIHGLESELKEFILKKNNLNFMKSFIQKNLLKKRMEHTLSYQAFKNYLYYFVYYLIPKHRFCFHKIKSVLHFSFLDLFNIPEQFRLFKKIVNFKFISINIKKNENNYYSFFKIQYLKFSNSKILRYNNYFVILYKDLKIIDKSKKKMLRWFNTNQNNKHYAFKLERIHSFLTYKKRYLGLNFLGFHIYQFKNKQKKVKNNKLSYCEYLQNEKILNKNFKNKKCNINIYSNKSQGTNYRNIKKFINHALSSRALKKDLFAKIDHGFLQKIFDQKSFCFIFSSSTQNILNILTKKIKNKANYYKLQDYFIVFSVFVNCIKKYFYFFIFDSILRSSKRIPGFTTILSFGSKKKTIKNSLINRNWHLKKRNIYIQFLQLKSLKKLKMKKDTMAFSPLYFFNINYDTVNHKKNYVNINKKNHIFNYKFFDNFKRGSFQLFLKIICQIKIQNLTNFIHIFPYFENFSKSFMQNYFSLVDSLYTNLNSGFHSKKSFSSLSSSFRQSFRLSTKFHRFFPTCYINFSINNRIIINLESILNKKNIRQTFFFKKNIYIQKNSFKNKNVSNSFHFDFYFILIPIYKNKKFQNIFTRIYPSKINIKNHMIQLKFIIKSLKAQTQEILIKKLAVKIRSWCEYYRIISNKKMFNYCDYLVFKMLWRWSCRRHPNKSRNWIKTKYFHNLNGKGWVFGFYNKDTSIFVCLPSHSETSLTIHIPIINEKVSL
uniref:Putative reverse transcriptase and intron maturase n=1 Tax=Treubaria triappendiculata TaxID=1755147 RepID=A0A0S2LMT8_TRETR|nr:putative reverse transcriptase and intron maturase [Treubaria triappendiculata]ALO62688.1 putative reverse transcriptase and intron maturase [Treubaria triappendiculata]